MGDEGTQSRRVLRGDFKVLAPEIEIPALRQVPLSNLDEAVREFDSDYTREGQLGCHKRGFYLYRSRDPRI